MKVQCIVNRKNVYIRKPGLCITDKYFWIENRILTKNVVISWKEMYLFNMTESIWKFSFIYIFIFLYYSFWFSPGTPVSSTNTTDHHDITEILLKVALSTISLTPIFLYIIDGKISYESYHTCSR